MAANPNMYLGTKFYDQLIGGHQKWLKGFDKVHLDAWDNLFLNDNSEGALCEAGTRQLLQELDVSVEPYPLKGNDRNPDFKCEKDSKLFYVDATCVMKDTATRGSRLDDVARNPKASYYSLLTNAYFRKAGKKKSQFENLNAPCIISIGTLHFKAGALCFNKMSAEEILTGKSGIGIQISKRTGGAVGDPYNSTSLESAPFLKARKIICDEPPIQPVWQTISAVLLCPFGTQPVKCMGILHPKPDHEFERNLLPHIEFCRLKAGWEGGTLTPEWI
ncbi:MAG: hypothetical protein FVQ82_00190 [Planctomycetes bacterium]|nr:hypothetical protein [Planctomycetota bacterium]